MKPIYFLLPFLLLTACTEKPLRQKATNVSLVYTNPSLGIYTDSIKTPNAVYVLSASSVKKVRFDGTTEWEKHLTLAEKAETHAFSLAYDDQNKDALFVLASYQNTDVHLKPSGYGYDILIAKIDLEGNFIKTFGNQGVLRVESKSLEIARDLIVLTNGNLLVAGNTRIQSNHGDPLLMEIDSQGKNFRRIISSSQDFRNTFGERVSAGTIWSMRRDNDSKNILIASESNIFFLMDDLRGHPNYFSPLFLNDQRLKHEYDRKSGIQLNIENREAAVAVIRDQMVQFLLMEKTGIPKRFGEKNWGKEPVFEKVAAPQLGVFANVSNVEILNGKYIVAATLPSNDQKYRIAFLRFNQNGTLDKTFGDQGVAVMQSLNLTNSEVKIHTTPDGGLIVNGNFEGNTALVNTIKMQVR